MENNEKIRVHPPRYQQIAADLASKIVEERYKVGEKIYARSSLASQYSVSPETARRAICVLSDLDIVSSEKGSGVTIKSYENAAKFVRQYQDVQTINDVKSSILESMERQKSELELFGYHLTTLLEKTDRFRSINPFMPFQIVVYSECSLLNQSISSSKFWQNTGATVIAIKRGDGILLSPGPYAVFLENDTVYFVGLEDCMERVSHFLYPTKALTDNGLPSSE